MPVDVRQRFKIDENLIERANAVLRPADLVLFFAEPPASSPVFHAQRAYGFPESVCAITHVGLYVGEGQLVHSQPASSLADRGGIRQENLVETMFGRLVVCLRFDGFVVPGAKSHIEHGLVASLARSAVGGRYDYAAIANLAIDAFRHAYPIPKRRPQSVRRYLATAGYADPRREVAKLAGDFICSDLVYNCYDGVFGRKNPMNRPDLMRAPHRLPVELFLNPRFLTVNLSSNGPGTLPAEFGPLTFGSSGGMGGPIVRFF